MALTISVIAGIALLLPGLFSVLFWNVRARRHSASRPDLPITAVSVLAISIFVSMLTHLITWYICFAGRMFGNEAGAGLQKVAPWLPLPTAFANRSGSWRRHEPNERSHGGGCDRFRDRFCRRHPC
jgi:hypothetical protein